jgi:hypothetical protein
VAPVAGADEDDIARLDRDALPGISSSTPGATIGGISSTPCRVKPRAVSVPATGTPPWSVRVSAT